MRQPWVPIAWSTRAATAVRVDEHDAHDVAPDELGRGGWRWSRRRPYDDDQARLLEAGHLVDRDDGALVHARAFPEPAATAAAASAFR